jgi:hypothetical protein
MLDQFVFQFIVLCVALRSAREGKQHDLGLGRLIDSDSDMCGLARRTITSKMEKDCTNESYRQLLSWMTSAETTKVRLRH